MRVIIAGSRDIDDFSLLERAVKESGFQITTVLSGCARGVDAMGEEWARRNKIACERYPADWSLGKRAGPLRNSKMATMCGEGGGLIAIMRRPGTPGTSNMIEQAYGMGLDVYTLLV